MGVKTLLIGLDALGPETLRRIMGAGCAPFLAALMSQSETVEIENYAGMGEGVFWPSVATGLGPAGHGRYFFQQFDPQDYEVKFRDDADHFDVESFWKRLDREGRKVAIVDWPRTPVEDLENGFLLDNWLGHDPVGPLRSRPRGFAENAAALFGRDPWGEGACSWSIRTADEARTFIDGGLRRIEMKTRFCVEKMHAQNWDLMAPVFSEPHDFGHYLWHLSDRGHPRFDQDIAHLVGDPFLRMGSALDQACRDLVKAAGEGACIMVLAGPGMSAMMSATPAMEEITRRLDLGRTTPPTATEAARKAYRRFVPYGFRGRFSKTVRRMLKPALHSEIAQRRFFSVPHNAHAGCIRVNLKGRERYGIVEPGEEYEALLEQVSRDLLQIRDADTGAPVVRKVARTRGIYAGRHAEALPDLFVIWRRVAHFTRIQSPKIGLIEIDSHPRTGDHVWDGFFWARGASLSGTETLAPHEIEPIILKAVLDRSPVAQTMSGAVLAYRLAETRTTP